jgi:hypothetical protein
MHTFLSTTQHRLALSYGCNYGCSYGCLSSETINISGRLNMTLLPLVEASTPTIAALPYGYLPRERSFDCQH